MSAPRDLRTLYLDLELECWADAPPRPPQIIQIGLVEVDLMALSVRREKCYYIRPKEYEISAYCTELTGIVAADLKRHGRALADVVRSIESEYGTRNKVTFTWGDDESAFVRELGAHPFRFTDLAHQFRMNYGIRAAVSLSDARKALGVTFHGREHDALHDALTTAYVHIEITRRARENGPPVNEERRLA
jgi:inhibitor of KinA sporulation pathway (predicted exonuclease)